MWICGLTAPKHVKRIYSVHILTSRSIIHIKNKDTCMWSSKPHAPSECGLQKRSLPYRDSKCHCAFGGTSLVKCQASGAFKRQTAGELGCSRDGWSRGGLVVLRLFRNLESSIWAGRIKMAAGLIILRLKWKQGYSIGPLWVNYEFKEKQRHNYCIWPSINAN